MYRVLFLFERTQAILSLAISWEESIQSSWRKWTLFTAPGEVCVKSYLPNARPAEGKTQVFLVLASTLSFSQPQQLCIFSSQRILCKNQQWYYLPMKCYGVWGLLHWLLNISPIRVAKVVRRLEGPSTKSLDLDENFKSQHTLFCRDIKICGDLRTIWKTLGKTSVLLGQKLYILGKKCTITLYIAYFTELNMQTCDYAQKRRKRRNFFGHFRPRRKAANFCHPVTNTNQKITT